MSKRIAKRNLSLSVGAGLESLEARRLMAVTPQVNFADFSSTAGLTGNGFGADPLTSGTALRMTTGVTHEARSIWNDAKVPVQKFTTHFQFQSDANPSTADGLVFVVQNGTTAELGADGLNLGYSGITAQSYGVAFNIYNFGGFGSQFSYASKGTRPFTTTDTSPLDLHSGGPFNATVTYDGRHLDVNVVDSSDTTKTFSARKNVNLAEVLGTDKAIVGFTASTGVFDSTQDLLSWDYAGSNTPTVASAAAATPNPTNTRTTALSVLGDDAGGESGLTYNWTVDRKPSGARAPTFSANGTNAAKGVTAKFFKDGTYRFRCTITNSGGLSTSSLVTVVVEQNAKLVRMSPHVATVALGGTIDYSAIALDQFNHAMRSQPTFTFAVDEGAGTINATTGVLTASSDVVGHLVISATAGSLSGTVGATVG